MKIKFTVASATAIVAIATGVSAAASNQSSNQIPINATTPSPFPSGLLATVLPRPNNKKGVSNTESTDGVDESASPTPESAPPSASPLPEPTGEGYTMSPEPIPTNSPTPRRSGRPGR